MPDLIKVPTQSGIVELSVSVSPWTIEFKNPTNGKLLVVGWAGVIVGLKWADALRLLEP